MAHTWITHTMRKEPSMSTHKKTVMLIFGTRPEAIKMAPVYHAINAAPGLKAVVCVTAQHRGLLDQVLEIFDIKPDFDLNLMTPGQTLYDITSGVLLGMKNVFEQLRPDLVLVHGDTTTTMSGAIAAFYKQIPVGHVEAGLRTFDMYSPFPEEMNRNIVGKIASLHFTPTRAATANLLSEGVNPKNIHQTGNTAIDALMTVADRVHEVPTLRDLFGTRPMILMTAHRRENFGIPLLNIFSAVLEFAAAHPDFEIIYPVHPNPNVKGPALEILSAAKNIHLIDPVGYEEMAFLMRECQFILTDSGGIQEEAPTLGKPILVLRDSTERPEAIDAGCAALVGSDPVKIKRMMNVLADTSSATYLSMSRAAESIWRRHGGAPDRGRDQ